MQTRNIFRLASIALAMGLSTFNVHSQEGNNSMEHTQIQATIDANAAAVTAKNMDGILATYAADALMVGPQGPPAIGHDALRAAFQNFLFVDPKITILKQEVQQAGDVALHTYAWKMTGKAPDGAAIEQSGLSMIVLRKQADGKWLMVIDHPFGDRVMR
jgi:uncharacterized protein (TIGR02246 family)